jgi:hypothetical protein
MPQARRPGESFAMRVLRLSHFLVQAADNPNQKKNRQRYAKQPQQKISSHKDGPPNYLQREPFGEIPVPSHAHSTRVELFGAGKVTYMTAIKNVERTWTGTELKGTGSKPRGSQREVGSAHR